MEEQFGADGHEVAPINILDYRVQGCGECMACKRGAVELCSIDDDANALFRRMAAVDMVLIAAPVFCWGFPAQVKALIDRMFCMMDFAGERASVPRLHGKGIALLLTGGGEEADNAELVIRGFEQLVQWLKGRMAGHLVRSRMHHPQGHRRRREGSCRRVFQDARQGKKRLNEVPPLASDLLLHRVRHGM